MWEQFTEFMNGLTNNPIFISMTSILSVLGSVLVILSKTSLGKKAIRKLTEMSNKTKDEVETVKISVDNAKKELDAKALEIEELNETFQNKLQVEMKTFYSQFDFYETQMYEILKLIPNAKVQEQLNKFYGEWQEKKVEIQEFIGMGNEKFNEELSEKMKEVEQLQHNFEELNGKLTALLETQNEERIDNETKEE